LSPQAEASTTPQITPRPAVVTDAVSFPGSAFATLPGAVQAQASAMHQASPAQPAKYKVRSGDTLSSIAKHFYQEDKAWPVLYWANHSQVRWADQISAGQVLKIPVKPAKIPDGPAATSPAPPPAPVAAPVSSSGGGGWVAPAQAAVSYSGSGGFASCVIARESGGNSQVMNSSGHYGLYQFSASTWAAYGGSSGDFGHASVGEQNRVFNNAIAAGGQSNWSAYDGC
jgi:LysM repeat protein